VLKLVLVLVQKSVWEIAAQAQVKVSVQKQVREADLAWALHEHWPRQHLNHL
jgi:hypothetical protein